MIDHHPAARPIPLRELQACREDIAAETPEQRKRRIVIPLGTKMVNGVLAYPDGLPLPPSRAPLPYSSEDITAWQTAGGALTPDGQLANPDWEQLMSEQVPLSCDGLKRPARNRTGDFLFAVEPPEESHLEPGTHAWLMQLRWAVVARLHPPGAIAFPGGFCEPGELALYAAIREGGEETGIQLKPDMYRHTAGDEQRRTGPRTGLDRWITEQAFVFITPPTVQREVAANVAPQVEEVESVMFMTSEELFARGMWAHHIESLRFGMEVWKGSVDPLRTVYPDVPPYVIRYQAPLQQPYNPMPPL